jgi:hypothetical protein
MKALLRMLIMARPEPDRGDEHSYAEGRQGDQWDRKAASNVAQSSDHNWSERGQQVADEEGHRGKPSGFFCIGGIV